MYWTLVRPGVKHACETWILKQTIKQKLLVFERKILRRIFGPTKERDGTWRIKTNDELNTLIGNKTTINYIKSQRLGWIGHVHRMPHDRMVKKVYEWKHMAIRSLGRPQNRWENDVQNDLNIMKIYNLKDCIQDRHKWKKIVEKAKTFNYWTCGAQRRRAIPVIVGPFRRPHNKWHT